MTKLTGAALDQAVANVLGIKSVHNCEKWVGLTDEEIGDEYVRFEVTKGGFNRFEYAVKAIEAKLKERNT
jgi:hypothetical protein